MKRLEFDLNNFRELETGWALSKAQRGQKLTESEARVLREELIQ